MRRDGYDVVVIGAGLVGAAVAYGLARAGQRVAVLDEEDAAYRASRGNFGLVWVQGKGVGSPEYARWSRASSERWFALSDALVEDCGIAPCYARPGGVVPALSEDELSDLDSMLAGLRQAAGNAGYEYEILDRSRVRELLPACGPEVAGGAWTPYDGHANPLKLMRGLHESLTVHGADYLPGARARDVRALAGGGFDVHTGRGTITRCGMGPCQGRMCATVVSGIFAGDRSAGPDAGIAADAGVGANAGIGSDTGAGVDAGAAGHYRIRPPVKPLTVGELAALEGAGWMPGRSTTSSPT